MELHDLVTSLRRRWYLVLAGLVVTAGLTAVVSSSVPPIYQMQASVVLVPGKSVIVEGGNPFLYLSGLVQARDVLVRTLGSTEVQAPIASRYPGATVAVQADATTSGPMVVISAEAQRPQAARGALHAMLTALPTQLVRLQDEVGAPTTARIKPLTLTVDNEATAVTKGRTRAVLAVVAVGIVATVLLTGLADGLLLARSLRRRPTPDDGEHPAVPPGTPGGRETSDGQQAREVLPTSPGPPAR